jgi:hypothetical protein
MAWHQNPVKPHGTQHIVSGSGYHSLAGVPKIVPTVSAMVIHEMYCNITYRLHHRGKAAKVRVKLVREAWHGQAEDPTSYQGYWLEDWAEYDIEEGGNFLLTRVAYELAEAHRPLHWELRVDGADIDISTRYAKAAAFG